MNNNLSRLFDVILAEAESNAAFRVRLEAALGSVIPQRRRGAARPSSTRQRNRRDRGLIDPYREFELGEAHLRSRLQTLSIEQLKDIVSEHALDSSRLALKWRSADRLVDHIVTAVRIRLEKGDAFRVEREPRMSESRVRELIGKKVKIRPAVRRLDDDGVELQSVDDDWMIYESAEPGTVIEIRNLATGHFVRMGAESVFEFRAPNILVLTEVLSLLGRHVHRNPVPASRGMYDAPSLPRRP